LHVTSEDHAIGCSLCFWIIFWHTFSFIAFNSDCKIRLNVIYFAVVEWI